MWDSAEVDRHKADYWEYETRHRANRTTAPRGGWDAYDPDAGVLKPEHATLYRLRKGQMLTAGGFNFHEGHAGDPRRATLSPASSDSTNTAARSSTRAGAAFSGFSGCT